MKVREELMASVQSAHTKSAGLGSRVAVKDNNESKPLGLALNNHERQCIACMKLESRCRCRFEFSWFR